MYRPGRAICLYFGIHRPLISLLTFKLHAIYDRRYNIYNKRILNILPMPWLMASAQLGIGLLYVFPLWLTKLRKAPKLAEGSLGPLRYSMSITHERRRQTDLRVKRLCRSTVGAAISRLSTRDQRERGRATASICKLEESENRE